MFMTYYNKNNRLLIPSIKISINLNKALLYTDEQQSFDNAIITFERINELLRSINE